jgi:glycosyltransferase involved in cell wall biosynthesis
LPVIEGFKAGRAVITSNISPMKETAANAACMVDPYDIVSIRENLMKVIADDTYRKQLIALGLKRVQEFDAAVITKQYVSLYNKMGYNSCVE